MPLLLAVIALALLLAFSPVPAVTPSMSASAPVVDVHYTKAGIVEINRRSGATRFVPYRYAGNLDRRRERAA